MKMYHSLAANMSFVSSTNIGNKLLLLPSTSPKTLPKSCKTNSSLLRFRLGRNQKCGISASYHEKTQVELPAGLEPERLPKHVAVIMDGNRRWAKSRGLPPRYGHMTGIKALEQLIFNCLKSGVKVLTVFAFSTENWIRPKEEVDGVMDSLIEFIANVMMRLMQNEVRISFMGRREQLSEMVREAISIAEETTKGYERMHLVVALNYSGRYDMTEATKKIATKVKDGVLQVEEIDDAVLEQHLGTNVIDEFPNPDLLIRSSGELRVSNFMLWQLAYTELFFSNKLFPEFDETDLLEAITEFHRRQRRFGGKKH